MNLFQFINIELILFFNFIIFSPFRNIKINHIFINIYSIAHTHLNIYTWININIFKKVKNSSLVNEDDSSTQQ